MKRGAPDHWKMADLARRLKVPDRYAMAWANGTIERMIHFTAVYAPRGDIGKVPDQSIAKACAWPASEATRLVTAMVESRWLDVNDNCRLVVHDWPDHCEDAVHSKLARARQYFACGVAPKLTGLRKTEIESARVYYRNHPIATPMQPVATGLQTPMQTIALALPCLSPALASTLPRNGNDWSHVEAFQAAWARHLKHRRDQPLDTVARVLIGRDESVDWIRLGEIHPRYCAYWSRKGWDFCGLTFLEWIDAGMPEPPPDPKNGDRQSEIDAQWEALAK